MKRSKLHLSAIGFMVWASVAFSLMALCVKLASRTLPSAEIVFFRSLFASIFIFTLMRRKKISIFGHRKRQMVLRGMFGFVALSLNFYAISRLSLGTAVMLNYTSPIFSAIFAILFLSERPSALLGFATFICFAGIYFLAGEQLTTFNFPVLMGLLSSIFASIAYVAIRSIRHKESPLTIIFYFTGISTIGSLCLLPWGFRWPDLLGWILIAGVAVGAFYGQLWMTIALRRAPASLVTPISYLAPLLTFGYDLVFFNQRLTIAATLGALLIISGNSLISYFETRKKADPLKVETSL